LFVATAARCEAFSVKPTPARGMQALSPRSGGPHREIPQ
jgi:hypothetical protein